MEKKESELKIAQLPPIALTIINVFFQAIEHLDKNGIFGNLTDVLGQGLQKESTHLRENH